MGKKNSRPVLWNQDLEDLYAMTAAALRAEPDMTEKADLHALRQWIANASKATLQQENERVVPGWLEHVVIRLCLDEINEGESLALRHRANDLYRRITAA